MSTVAASSKQRTLDLGAVGAWSTWPVQGGRPLPAAVLGWAAGVALAPLAARALAIPAPDVPVAGLALAQRLMPGLLVVAALLALVGAALAIDRRREGPGWTCPPGAIALVAALVALLWTPWLAPRPAPDDVALMAPRRFARLEAVVVSPPARTDDGWRARCWIMASRGYPAGPRSGLVDASWPSAARPGVGTAWLLAGRLVRPEGPRNPGEQDRRLRLARQGVFALVRASEASQLGPAPGYLGARWLDALRVRLLDGLGAGLSSDRAALLGSLVLGTGASPVDPTLADHFRTIGLSHLLAASGAQVGMLSAVACAGLLRAGMPPAAAAALTLPCLLLYLQLTGAPASMVRATLMGAVALGGLALERAAAPFAALWLAAGAMLVWDPGSLYDLGFQFSFLATYALCRLSAASVPEGESPTSPRQRLVAWARASLRISWAANTWVLPWQLYVFQQGSFLALPANLLAEPLVLLLTPWGVAVSVMGALWAPLARLVAPLTNLQLGLLEALVTALAAIPWGGFVTPALPMVAVAACYLALVVGKRRRAAFTACLGFAGLAVLAPHVHPARLEVTVVSVGQGDAIAIHAPGDHWAVIDAGPAFRGQDAGAQVLLPYLRREGCRRLELVVATHAHLDHIGGLPALAAALPVASAWDPGQHDPGEPYQLLMASWLRQGIAWSVATAGMHWNAGGAELEVLSQPAPEATLNDGSIVTRLTYGHFRMLLMGDAEAAGESRLLARTRDLTADVLKVGHHGSHTSSTPSLLAAVRPRVAVISVGRDNRFGHPDAPVVARLAACGARVLRTDLDGAVVFRSDGRRTWLATGRDGWSRWAPLPAARTATQGVAAVSCVAR